MRRIYLDYAAATPLDPRVRRAMEPYFGKKFGNPGSIHSFGQEAIAALDRAREDVAAAVGAGFREIIFTGSATEANNLALRGLARMIRARRSGGQGSTRVGIRENRRAIGVHPRPRFIVSAVEHESVRETARDLEEDGIEVVEIPVSRGGVVDLGKLEKALNERTALVSVMYANNEIGTVQPISKISEVIRNFRASRVMGQASRLSWSWPVAHDAWPLFHTDAAQAFQFLDCNVDKLGIDMMTLSGHKIYGPKGIGALYVRPHVANSKERRAGLPFAIITGGGQEFGFRSGTENVPFIVGFAEAARLALRIRASEAKRIAGLRDGLWRGIKKIYPNAEINGVSSFELRASSGPPRVAHPPLTIPNILNVYFPGCLAEEFLMKLDFAGIAASAGPACSSSRTLEPSRVIQALGYDETRARHSIRFSLGRQTSNKEIAATLKILSKLFRAHLNTIGLQQSIEMGSRSNV